jgi:hypothetical protein
MATTFELTSDTIRRIAAVLGADAQREEDHFRFELQHADPPRQLVLEVYPSIPIGNAHGALISIFTSSANLQLQHCTGVVFSEMLGEVTFVAETETKISGLIVEREAACSLYANVDRELLSGDFTTLGPEIMMSSIALSLSDVDVPEDELPEAETGGVQ